MKEMHAIETFEQQERTYNREREVIFLVEKTSERYEETLDHVRELRRLIDKCAVQFPAVNDIFENEIRTYRPDTTGKRLETATLALKLSARVPVPPLRKEEEKNKKTTREQEEEEEETKLTKKNDETDNNINNNGGGGGLYDYIPSFSFPSFF